MFHRTRTLLPFLALLVFPLATLAQDRAGACFFSADFEDGVIPTGWDVGPLVEMEDAAGNGLDTFVTAWTVGNAAAANAGGFFPVPGVPIGNQFAMANDDAPPCNCDMADLALTTSPIDLSGRNGVALECRVFHEQALGGGPASVEVSFGGGSWITMATVPVLAGGWQHLFVNLSAFDGQPDLRIRFRWSDGGNWATGFAVDDICLRERTASDLSLVNTYTHDISADPFTTGDQGLYYSMVPLSQAGPMTVSAELMNRGMNTLQGITVEATISLNGTVAGPFTSDAWPELLPGARALVTIPTGWVADAIGLVEVEFTASSAVTDDDPSDNSGNATMRISGPGWEDGYGAMAADAGQYEGEVGGAQAFIATNRFELRESGVAPTGISAFLSGVSQVGEPVRAILFDGNLAFVDTSSRHFLTEEDVIQAGMGEAIFLPLSNTSALPAGDYFAGLQHLDVGFGGQVRVSTSGTGPIGRALLMEGITFDLTYLLATPMVRLHFNDYGVGLEPVDESLNVNGIHVFPVPMGDQGRIRFELEQASRVTLYVLDMTGRSVWERDLGRVFVGYHEEMLEVSHLSAGTYVVRLTVGGDHHHIPVIVTR